ncbi:hypothetical protein H4219_006384 [Mycoemilia scoparia]|uniref:Uncharacterized protein n=1 Tax=Mycoemilia scoparia TaxID=417184 RepID=A0A9W7ZSQ1_9FUNG|nr:hypothetical protein H4219_006384 [Mycoemilia scoparia]
MAQFNKTPPHGTENTNAGITTNTSDMEMSPGASSYQNTQHIISINDADILSNMIPEFKSDMNGLTTTEWKKATEECLGIVKASNMSSLVPALLKKRLDMDAKRKINYIVTNTAEDVYRELEILYPTNKHLLMLRNLLITKELFKGVPADQAKSVALSFYNCLGKDDFTAMSIATVLSEVYLDEWVIHHKFCLSKQYQNSTKKLSKK